MGGQWKQQQLEKSKKGKITDKKRCHSQGLVASNQQQMEST